MNTPRPRIDKAVILAAGLGNRIAELRAATPKPMLPLDGLRDGPCFLDWHVRSLAERGVGDIIIVGNRVTYGCPLRWGTPAVRWVLNPTEDLSTSGSGHSASLAFASNAGAPVLDGTSRVILMDADIIYDPAALDVLAMAPGERSKTLVCDAFRASSEEVMVLGRGGEPVVHGKGLLGTPMADGLDVLGEATGILLWEPGDHALLRAVTDWTMQYSTAKQRTEHEDLTQRMMGLGRVASVAIDRSYGFMEVDTPEEYRVLTADVYPRLAKRVGW